MTAVKVSRKDGCVWHCSRWVIHEFRGVEPLYVKHLPVSQRGTMGYATVPAAWQIGLVQ